MQRCRTRLVAVAVAVAAVGNELAGEFGLDLLQLLRVTDGGRGDERRLRGARQVAIAVVATATATATATRIRTVADHNGLGAVVVGLAIAEERDGHRSARASSAAGAARRRRGRTTGAAAATVATATLADQIAVVDLFAQLSMQVPAAVGQLAAAARRLVGGHRRGERIGAHLACVAPAARDARCCCRAVTTASASMLLLGWLLLLLLLLVLLAGAERRRRSRRGRRLVATRSAEEKRLDVDTVVVAVAVAVAAVCQRLHGECGGRRRQEERRRGAHLHVVLLEYDGHVVDKAVDVVARDRQLADALHVDRLAHELVERHIIVASPAICNNKK